MRSSTSNNETKDIAVICNCTEDFVNFEKRMASVVTDAKYHPITVSADINSLDDSFRCQAIIILSNVKRDKHFLSLLDWVNTRCEGNKILIKEEQ